MISALYVLLAQSSEDPLLNLFERVQHRCAETGWAGSNHSSALTADGGISQRTNFVIYMKPYTGKDIYGAK